jgi:bacteriorhodopsin
MDISYWQYELVYNAFSFTIAAMGAATLFFWLGRSQVSDAYKTALTITGLVTAIAFYHYFRIFNSWEAAFTAANGEVHPTGIAFNDAYRYVDWLLTVPLLLIELILVMRLPKEESRSKSWRLGSLAAIMIVLGYPGEVAGDLSSRWIWWAAAMVPFALIVSELFIGLKNAISQQAADVRGLVNTARWLTLVAWSFYPVVFIFPMIGLTGGTAETAVQVGYSIADVVAKAVFGVVIYMIAVRKSDAERNEHGVGRVPAYSS